MLVLSRRVGESLQIGDDVVVTVLEVRGDVVRLGIAAPRSVAVNRSELLIQLESSNQAAASPSEQAVAALAAQLRERPTP
ncbi:carbon storage regulator CsrA [Nocardioides sp.]|uniref:carbon storage regulator CsrA n=1 Tax=Nocardioides sp. TaxID=35761 RepID=UPI003519AADE